jgi:hypothetical protein
MTASPSWNPATTIAQRLILTCHFAQDFVTDRFPNAGMTMDVISPKNNKNCLMKLEPIEFTIYSVFF